jgi:ABC transport system ATP-binding/permease protein
VQQEDAFLNLTIRQQLMFSARLRQSYPCSMDKIEALVDKVVETLALGFCQHMLISLASGGERKRCSIGSELVSDPSLLLMDEVSAFTLHSPTHVRQKWMALTFDL